VSLFWLTSMPMTARQSFNKQAPCLVSNYPELKKKTQGITWPGLRPATSWHGTEGCPFPS
jgi:hypothetical protein